MWDPTVNNKSIDSKKKSNGYSTRLNPAKIVIGVDPGRHTAIAIMIHGIIHECATYDFWDFFLWLEQNEFDKDTTLFVVEDGAKVAPTFHHGANNKADSQINKRIGRNHESGDLLAEGVRRMGYQVARRPPRHTKKSRQEMYRQTGYEGRTNEHERDAMALIIGRKWQML